MTTLAFDRTRKAAVYAQARVEDYWIVNPNARQVEVHGQPGALPDGTFANAEYCRCGGGFAALSAKQYIA